MTVNIGQWENRINARNKVGLELVEIDVEGAIEPQRGGDGGNNLGDEAVEVGKAWLGDTQLLLANVEDGLVVDLDRDQKLIGQNRKYSERVP